MDGAYSDTAAPTAWGSLVLQGQGTHCTLRLENVTLRQALFFQSDDVRHSRVGLVDVSVDPTMEITNVIDTTGTTVRLTTLAPLTGTTVDVGNVLENTTFEWYGRSGGNVWNRWAEPSPVPGSALPTAAELDRFVAASGAVRMKQSRLQFRRVVGTGTSVLVQSVVMTVHPSTGRTATLTVSEVSSGAAVLISNTVVLQNTTNDRVRAFNVEKAEFGLVLLDNCWIATRSVDAGTTALRINANRATLPTAAVPPRTAEDLAFLPFSGAISDRTKELLLAVVPQRTLQGDAATLVVLRQCVVQVDVYNDGETEYIVALDLRTIASVSSLPPGHQFAGPAFVVVGTNTTVASDGPRTLLFISNQPESVLIIAGNATSITGGAEIDPNLQGPSLFFSDHRRVADTAPLLSTDSSMWAARQSGAFGPSRHASVGRANSVSVRSLLVLSFDAAKHIWVIGNDGNSMVESGRHQTAVPGVRGWTADAFIAAADGDSVVNTSWPVQLTPSWSDDAAPPPPDAPAKGRPVCGLTVESAAKGLSLVQLRGYATTRSQIVSFVVDSVQFTIGVGAVRYAVATFPFLVGTHVSVVAAFSLRRLSFEPGAALTNVGGAIAAGPLGVYQGVFSNGTSSASPFGFPTPGDGQPGDGAAFLPITVTSEVYGIAVLGANSKITGSNSSVARLRLTSLFFVFRVNGNTATCATLTLESLLDVVLANSILAIEGMVVSLAVVHFARLSNVQELRLANNDIIGTCHYGSVGYTLSSSIGGADVARVSVEAGFVSAAAAQSRGFLARAPFRAARPGQTSAVNMLITFRNVFIAARALWTPFGDRSAQQLSFRSVLAIGVVGELAQTSLLIQVSGCLIHASDSFMVAPRVFGVAVQVAGSGQYGEVGAYATDSVIVVNSTKHLGEDVGLIPVAPSPTGRRKADFALAVRLRPVDEQHLSPVRHAAAVAMDVQTDLPQTNDRFHAVLVQHSRLVAVANWIPCGVCFDRWVGNMMLRNSTVLIADGALAYRLDGSPPPASANTFFPLAVITNTTHLEGFLDDDAVQRIAARGVASAVQFMVSFVLGVASIEQVKTRVFASTPPQFLHLYNRDEEAARTAAVVPPSSPLPTEAPFEHPPTAMWRSSPRHLFARPVWDVSNLQGTAAFLHFFTESATGSSSRGLSVVSVDAVVTAGDAGHCFGVGLRTPLADVTGLITVAETNVTLRHDAPSPRRWRDLSTAARTSASDNTRPAAFTLARPMRTVTAAVFINGTQKKTGAAILSAFLLHDNTFDVSSGQGGSLDPPLDGPYSSRSPLGEFGGFMPASAAPGASTTAVVSGTDGLGATVDMSRSIAPVRRDLYGFAVLDCGLSIALQDNTVVVEGESTILRSPSAESNATIVALCLVHNAAAYFFAGTDQASSLRFTRNNGTVRVAAPRLNQLLRRPLCGAVPSTGPQAPWSYDALVASTLRRQASVFVIDHRRSVNALDLTATRVVVDGVDVPRAAGFVLSARPVQDPRTGAARPYLVRVESTDADIRARTGVATGIAIDALSIQSVVVSEVRLTVTGTAAAAALVVRAMKSVPAASLVVQVGNATAAVESAAGPAVFLSTDSPQIAPAIAHRAAALGGQAVAEAGAVTNDASVNISGNAALCGDENAVKAACLLGRCARDPGVASRLDYDALVQHCVSVTSTTVAAANNIADASVPSGVTPSSASDPSPSSVITVSLREVAEVDVAASLPSGAAPITQRVLSSTTAVTTSGDGGVSLLRRSNVAVRVASDLMALPDDYAFVAEAAMVAAGRLVLSTNPGAASFELVPPGRRPGTTFVRPAPLAAVSLAHGAVPSIHVVDSRVTVSVASSISAALLASSPTPGVSMPTRLSHRCTPMMSGRGRGGGDVSFIAPTCVGDPRHSLGARLCHPVAVLFATTAGQRVELRDTTVAVDVGTPLSYPVVSSALVIGSVRVPAGRIPNLDVRSVAARLTGGPVGWFVAMHGPAVASRTLVVAGCNVTAEATVHTADLAIAPAAWASNWTGPVALPPFVTAQLQDLRSASGATLGHGAAAGHALRLARLLSAFPSVWIDSAPFPDTTEAVLSVPRTEAAIVVTPGPHDTAAVDVPITNISVYGGSHEAFFANVLAAAPLSAGTVTATLLRAPTVAEASQTLSNFSALPQAPIAVSAFIERPLLGLVFAQALWGSPSAALPSALTARGGGWVTAYRSIIRYSVAGAGPDARRVVPVLPASTGDLPRLASAPTYARDTPWLGGLSVQCVAFEDELYTFAPDVSLGLGVPPPRSASAFSTCSDVCQDPLFMHVARECWTRTATASRSASVTEVVVPVTAAPTTVLTTAGGIIATGATAAVASVGAVGVAANVGRVTFLAALVECDGGLETGEPLPVQSHPARVGLGAEDDPLRYHIGAVVCNVAVPAAAALLWMAAVFLWCYARGKLAAPAGDAAKAAPRKDAPMSGKEQAALVMSYARLPSLLSVPFMLFVQPTFSSALLVVMKATDPFVRFAGAAVLVGIAALFFWALWALAYTEFPAVFVPTVCDPSMKPTKTREGSAEALSGAHRAEGTDGHPLAAKAKALAVWLLEPVGEWVDLFPDGTVAQRTFVQRHFLLIADYTGRWRWFIVVEVGLNAVLAVIEATATEESCTAAAWVTTVLSFAYVAVVLWCRPHESVFNFYFTLFLGAANAVAALLASVHQHVRSDALVDTVEVFLRVALLASSLRLAYDVARVAMQLLRRRARDTHRLLRRAARMMAGRIDGRLVSPADAEALAALYGPAHEAGGNAEDSDSSIDAGASRRCPSDGEEGRLAGDGPQPESHCPKVANQAWGTESFEDTLLPPSMPRAPKTARESKYVPSWTFQPERYRRNMERLTGVALTGGGDGGLPRDDVDAHDGEHVDSMVRDMAADHRRQQRERRARVARLAAESEARALQFAAFTADQAKASPAKRTSI